MDPTITQLPYQCPGRLAPPILPPPDDDRDPGDEDPRAVFWREYSDAEYARSHSPEVLG